MATRLAVGAAACGGKESAAGDQTAGPAKLRVALLTPGPDVFSQCMLAVPMIALYELGILLMGNGEKRKRATA